MDINRNDYETSFLLYLDRELGPAEMHKVEKFLTENPDLQKEFVLLQQAIFLPEDIVYDQKELLFHREEKRRAIPLYWVRIAASIIVLMTAGWFLLKGVLNNNKGELSVNYRNPAAIVPVTIKKIPVSSDLKINDKANQTGVKDILKNKNQKNQNRELQIVKNTYQSNQGSIKRLPLKNNSSELNTQNKTLHKRGDANSQDISIPEESLVAVQKSNAALEIQPDKLHTGTDPKQISALPGTRTMALVLVTAGSKDQIKDENTDLKVQNFQTDNAISIVALNDQNKAITGFFKKLTKHNPDDDKTNNARKVRVSVFQFSY